MSSDLRAQLEALLAVAREGSMTAAAAREHYSLATTSRLISGLEKRVGAPLVERRDGRTHLTVVGRRTVAIACPIVCAATELEHGISAADGGSCHAEPDLPCAGYSSCPGRAADARARPSAPPRPKRAGDDREPLGAGSAPSQSGVRLPSQRVSVGQRRNEQE